MPEGRIESISNGLGSQSMYMVVLAAEGQIPATVSITADTGSENDRLWSTGRRSTAEEYFRLVVEPYCHENRIDARFVRARDKSGALLPSLIERVKKSAEQWQESARRVPLPPTFLPLFGSDGGRLSQSCTQRWKVVAISQELRRMGTKTARTAQGIHFGEAARRVKGKYIGLVDGIETYQTTFKRKGADVPIKWLTHYYPLVERRLRRPAIREELDRRSIPYLVTTECDACPHQDTWRWLNHTEESIEQTAAIEDLFGGKFFFTDRRIPLRRAIDQMRYEASNPLFETDAEFGCGNSYCGV